MPKLFLAFASLALVSTPALAMGVSANLADYKPSRALNELSDRASVLVTANYKATPADQTTVKKAYDAAQKAHATARSADQKADLVAFEKQKKIFNTNYDKVCAVLTCEEAPAAI